MTVHLKMSDHQYLYEVYVCGAIVLRTLNDIDGQFVYRFGVLVSDILDACSSTRAVWKRRRQQQFEENFDRANSLSLVSESSTKSQAGSPLFSELVETCRNFHPMLCPPPRTPHAERLVQKRTPRTYLESTHAPQKSKHHTDGAQIHCPPPPHRYTGRYTHTYLGRNTYRKKTRTSPRSGKRAKTPHW